VRSVVVCLRRVIVSLLVSQRERERESRVESVVNESPMSADSECHFTSAGVRPFFFISFFDSFVRFAQRVMRLKTENVTKFVETMQNIRRLQNSKHNLQRGTEQISSEIHVEYNGMEGRGGRG